MANPSNPATELLEEYMRIYNREKTAYENAVTEYKELENKILIVGSVKELLDTAGTSCDYSETQISKAVECITETKFKGFDRITEILNQSRTDFESVDYICTTIERIKNALDNLNKVMNNKLEIIHQSITEHYDNYTAYQSLINSLQSSGSTYATTR